MAGTTPARWAVVYDRNTAAWGAGAWARETIEYAGEVCAGRFDDVDKANEMCRVLNRGGFNPHA